MFLYCLLCSRNQPPNEYVVYLIRQLCRWKILLITKKIEQIKKMCAFFCASSTCTQTPCRWLGSSIFFCSKKILHDDKAHRHTQTECTHDTRYTLTLKGISRKLFVSFNLVIHPSLLPMFLGPLCGCCCSRHFANVLLQRAILLYKSTYSRVYGLWPTCWTIYGANCKQRIHKHTSASSPLIARAAHSTLSSFLNLAMWKQKQKSRQSFFLMQPTGNHLDKRTGFCYYFFFFLSPACWSRLACSKWL